MPLGDDVERAYQRTYGKSAKPGRRSHKIQGKLRTAENAETICELLAQGKSLSEVARRFECHPWSILKWVREDDERTNGAVIGKAYARAREIGYELLADSLVAVAERNCVGVDGRVDPGAVQQARLEVDTKKWMLSKMLPRVYGDKVEVSGNPDAPVLTRIELVAVHPKPREPEPLTIDHHDHHQNSAPEQVDATRAHGEITDE